MVKKKLRPWLKTGTILKIVDRRRTQKTEHRSHVVACGDALSNESMKPSHLKNHLTTEHADLNEKNFIFP